MTSQRSKHSDDAQLRTLRLPHENPEMSQRQLSKAVGISVGGGHYVLNALLEAGLVNFGHFAAAAYSYESRMSTRLCVPRLRAFALKSTADILLINRYGKHESQAYA